MPKTITIYCEGKKDSHDVEILKKVRPYPNILIQPIGGIRGARRAVQVYEEKSIIKSDFYLLFRDRDFDKPVPPISQLEPMYRNANNYEYCTYFTTIESYLFDVQHFFDFVSNKGLNTTCGINSEEDAKNLFIRAAEQIKYYQAVRHAMGKMRTGDTNFGTKLMPKSGQLPTQLDENYCITKGWEKIQAAKNIADSWTKTLFEQEVAGFLSLFNTTSFMDNLQFLVYFQGKDFASSLKKLLPDNFSMKAYYTYAKRNFDYTKFPDLVQLHQMLKTEYEKP